MTIDLAALLSMLAALVVVLGGIAAGVVSLRRWIRSQVAVPLGQMQTDVTSVQAGVGHVRSEVSPNHGDSMYDAIGRIDRALANQIRRYDEHLLLGHGIPIRAEGSD